MAAALRSFLVLALLNFRIVAALPAPLPQRRSRSHGTALAHHAAAGGGAARSLTVEECRGVCGHVEFLSTSVSGLESLADADDAANSESHNYTAVTIAKAFGEKSLLPKVLIMGDSVALAYSKVVTGLLKGTAEVFTQVSRFPLAYRRTCGTSAGQVACVGDWLNNTRWDVISFNWGLHDVSPSLYSTVSQEEYTTRLVLMYSELSTKLAPQGKLLWQSTTPVPPHNVNRKDTDVIALNEIAEKVWAQVPSPPAMSDLYRKMVHACHQNVTTKCYPRECECAQLQKSGNVHFTDQGNLFLGMQVASQIAALL